MNNLINRNHDEAMKELEMRIAIASRDIRRNVIESLGGKPIDAKELNTLLLAKADKSEVCILEKIKADRTLVSGYDQSIDVLSSQISHLITMLISFVKADLKGKPMI